MSRPSDVEIEDVAREMCRSLGVSPDDYVTYNTADECIPGDTAYYGGASADYGGLSQGSRWKSFRRAALTAIVAHHAVAIHYLKK